MPSSTSPEYADRLVRLSGAGWKRFVPNPYRRLVRREAPGRVLDVGCGIGRCLGFLDGRGVGVDPNEAAVAECRRRGFTAYTPAELAASDTGPFDSLLCTHVIEHLPPQGAVALLAPYLGRVRTGGRVVVVVPQQRGFASDETHVTYVDAAALRRLASDLGLRVERVRSFPLPRWAGRRFVYNETVLIARHDGAAPPAAP